MELGDLPGLLLMIAAFIAFEVWLYHYKKKNR